MNAPARRRRSHTREELRRDRWRALGKLALGLLVAALVLLALSLDDAPPPGSREREGAATFAASQECDRVMELYGDEDAAQRAAQAKYEEVMQKWEP